VTPLVLIWEPLELFATPHLLSVTQRHLGRLAPQRLSVTVEGGHVTPGGDLG
jgi:hypothetical protein